MTDPVSLAVVGGVVLAEGIKFLYGQAGELIKAWRGRREKHEAAANDLPVLTPAQGVLDGRVDASRRPDVAVLDEQSERLSAARRELARYADPDDPLPVSPDNRELLGHVEELRDILELIYGQRLTFVGENRDRTGTVLTATVTAERLRNSQAVGIANAAQAAEGIRADGKLTARDLDGSTAVGIDFGGIPKLPGKPGS